MAYLFQRVSGVADTSSYWRTKIGSCNFGYGTFMVLIKVNSLDGTNPGMVMFFNTSASAAAWGWGIMPTGIMRWFSSSSVITNKSDGATAVGMGKWYILGAGKATGTSAPRFHLYDFTTQTWLHENGNASRPDATAPGSAGYLLWGSQTPANTYTLDAYMETSAFWDSLLTDAQVESLCRTGSLMTQRMNWLRLLPKGMWEMNRFQPVGSAWPGDLTGQGADFSFLGSYPSTVTTPVSGPYQIGGRSGKAHSSSSAARRRFAAVVG